MGIDLHRRRSVLVRKTETGETLETVRISNDPDYLRQVMTRAGEAPEVVLEAAYGWYWAADTLAELGAHVHLAHPLGVKMFSYRRVKNDEHDAGDLAERALSERTTPQGSRPLVTGDTRLKDLVEPRFAEVVSTTEAGDRSPNTPRTYRSHVDNQIIPARLGNCE